MLRVDFFFALVQTLPTQSPLVYKNPVQLLISRGVSPIDVIVVLIPYNKLPTTFEDQIKLFENRGLKLENKSKVLHLLKKISYYRFSAYCYPLLVEPKSAHTFKDGASFEKAYTIYKFDRELRLLVVRELEKIEVAIRSQIINVMSNYTGTPFWLNDPTNFKEKEKHTRTIIEMKNDYRKSDAQFLKAFKNKYSDYLPPSWMILELMPFGNLSILYENLSPVVQKREIAEYFGLDRKTFTSWIHCFAYLRNVCAHHMRLWNREMGIQPKIPTELSKTWLKKLPKSNSRCFFLFSTILYILQTVDPRNQFIFKIRMLFNKYPNIDPVAMGFPSEWECEPLWELRPTIIQSLKLAFSR